MPCFIINLVTEAGGVNDSQRDSGAFIIQFEFFKPVN
jgi:hypothetical protein